MLGFTRLFGAPQADSHRRRATDRPLSLKRARQAYETPFSFTRLLPWMDYDPRQRVFVLEDGRSLGAMLELTPAACEARPPQFLAAIHERLQAAIVHALPDDDVPWIVQFYAHYEPVDARAWVERLRAYADPEARDTVLAEHYFGILEEHLREVSRSQGYFQDPRTGGLWRGRRLRVYACLSRRAPRGWRPAGGATLEQEINLVAHRLTNSLQAAGVGARRCTGRDLFGWLLRWFNPDPNIPGHRPDDLAALVRYDEAAAERPFGYDLSETLVLGMPATDLQGNWYFDGMPHTVLTVQQLHSSPRVGLLTGEPADDGNQAASLLDRMPEGTVLAVTMVVRPQDRIAEYLEDLNKSAVGAAPEAVRAREEIQVALARMAANDRGRPLNIALYLRAPTLEELQRREEAVIALLLAEGVQAITRENDLVRHDAYWANLPMSWDERLNKDARWSHLNYSSHIAAALPTYGRWTGTGHPGIVLYNRGGEPLTFDPLNHEDRKQNGHTLIVGPTGAGKSSFLLNYLEHMQAVHRPRIILVEVGRSFELYVPHLRRHGVNVHRVMLTPGQNVALPISNDALALARRTGATPLLAPAATDDSPWAADEDTDPQASERDYLSEMEAAARLMVTGGRADEILRRADQRLIQMAIVEAGRRALQEGRGHVLPADVARALKSLEGLDQAAEIRASEMSRCLEMYTEGFAGQVFNRPATPWPDADVTVVNLGTFAGEGQEDKLALAVIGLVNYVNALAEATRASGRQTILCFDEAHLVTSHPHLAPYLTKAIKVWGRRYAVWLWLATQNVGDFPDAAARMLNNIEWWICLHLPPEEIERLRTFRDLTEEQRAMLLAVRKEPGRYTEGVLLHFSACGLFRNVPPPLMLALAMTEAHERRQRVEIMRELQARDGEGVTELDAAYEMARRIQARRLQEVTQPGGGPLTLAKR